MGSTFSVEDRHAFHSAAAALAPAPEDTASDDLLGLVPGLIEPNLKIAVRGCIFYYRPIEASCLADPEQNARLLADTGASRQDGSKTLLGLDIRHVLADVQGQIEEFIRFGQMLKELLRVEKVVLLRWSAQVRQCLRSQSGDQLFIFFDEDRAAPAPDEG